jgi:uncharacterized protein with FMN-binding domain
MRRIAVAIAATVSALVLLFSYRTSTGQDTVSASGPLPLAPRPVTSPVTSPATSPATSPGSGSAPPSSAPASPSGSPQTFAGAAADTRYGPVQVQITVSGGKITSAQVLQVPQESSRDVRINSEAVPILNQEVLQAQSAQVDTVSGATYTSEGYAQSLQSAIDAAHL